MSVAFAAFAVLVLSSLFGFVAVFFNFFGTAIIFAGALIFAYLTGFEALTRPELAVLFAMFVAGELLEWLLLAFGAKKLGASNAAVGGGIAGGIFGGLLGLFLGGVGVFPGAIAGIFAGAFLAESRSNRGWVQSVKSASGSVLGTLGALAAKVLVALAMIVYASVQAIPYLRQA